MPLRHVLYRCPLCGHDPTEGKGDEAACRGCGASFTRAPSGVRVLGDGVDEVSPVALLVDRIEELGGCLTAAVGEDGAFRYASPVLYHGFLEEREVRGRGRLLGFRETPGTAVDGVLELTARSLTFLSAERSDEWPLDSVTALQVSTRSLQLGILRRGTLQMTFPEASTLRWEALLQHAIQELWTSRGRGTIAEFQPRISGL
jgi:hypothetical protein